MRLSLFFAFFILTSPLLAIDYQKYQISFISKDEKIFFDEIKTFLTLKTETNQMIQIIHTGEMTDALFDRIIQLKQKFDQWNSIKIKAIQFIVQKDTIDFVIMLSSFNFQNKDYMKFIPNGMSFFLQNDRISYDFRILKDKQSHKFSGILESEKEFLDKFLIYINEKKPEEFIKKQEEAKQAPKDKAFKENEKPFYYKNAIKIFAGSGTLLGLGYSRVFAESFEPMVFGGIVYYKSKDSFGDELTKIGAPAGLRLNYILYHSSVFQPYLYAGGQYNLSVKNYESRMIAFGGIGQVVFKYFFAEISYMYSKNWDGIVIGFGLNIPF